MELISVVIPIYNVEKYLKQCLHSVRNQTYSNLQIILVDDGSEDNSARICRELIELDDRFEYHLKKNGGLSDARNFGMKFVKGEYVAFLDSDDMIVSDYFKILYNNIKKEKAEISIVSFNYIGEKGEYVHRKKNNPKVYVMGRNSALYKMYSKKHNIDFVTAWGKLYRFSLWEDIYYPINKRNEDEFITYKLYLKANKIVFQDYKGYLYRIRPGSIMNSSFSVKNLDILEAIKERIKVLEGIEEKIVVLTECIYCMQLIRNIILLKKNDIYIDNIEEMVKELNKYYKVNRFIKNRINLFRLLKVIFLKNRMQYIIAKQ